MTNRFKVRYQEAFGKKIGRPTGKSLVILCKKINKEIPNDVFDLIKTTATIAKQAKPVKDFTEQLLVGIQSEDKPLIQLKTKIIEVLKSEAISVRFDAVGVARALELMGKPITTVFSVFTVSTQKIDDLEEVQQKMLLGVLNGK